MRVSVVKPTVACAAPYNILRSMKAGQFAWAHRPNSGLMRLFLRASDDFIVFPDGDFLTTSVKEVEWVCENYFADKVLPEGTEITITL